MNKSLNAYSPKSLFFAICCSALGVTISGCQFSYDTTSDDSEMDTMVEIHNFDTATGGADATKTDTDAMSPDTYSDTYAKYDGNASEESDTDSQTGVQRVKIEDTFGADTTIDDETLLSSDTEAMTDANAATLTLTDTAPDSNAMTNMGMPTDADTAINSDTAEAAGASTDSAPETDADTAPDSEPEADTGSATDTGTATDVGTAADTDASTDTGTATSTDDTETDSESEVPEPDVEILWEENFTDDIGDIQMFFVGTVSNNSWTTLAIYDDFIFPINDTFTHSSDDGDPDLGSVELKIPFTDVGNMSIFQVGFRFYDGPLDLTGATIRCRLKLVSGMVLNVDDTNIVAAAQVYVRAANLDEGATSDCYADSNNFQVSVSKGWIELSFDMDSLPIQANAASIHQFGIYMHAENNPGETITSATFRFDSFVVEK